MSSLHEFFPQLPRLYPAANASSSMWRLPRRPPPGARQRAAPSPHRTPRSPQPSAPSPGCLTLILIDSGAPASSLGVRHARPATRMMRTSAPSAGTEELKGGDLTIQPPMKKQDLARSVRTSAAARCSLIPLPPSEERVSQQLTPPTGTRPVVHRPPFLPTLSWYDPTS